jgi:hypothetical protein
VTITVPPSGLIGIGLRGEARPHGKAVVIPMSPSSGFISPTCAEIGLYEATDFSTSKPLFQSCNSSTDTADIEYRPANLVFVPGVYWTKLEATPGQRTYSLRYRLACLERPCTSGDRAFFRNRKLWVRPGG